MLLKPSEYFRITSKKASKKLGQHFLIQPVTAQRIVESANITSDDIVVEIGPGLGALTRLLIDKPCELHLVEIDRLMAEELAKRVPNNARARIIWHVQDILEFDWQRLAIKQGQRLKVLGNIPYNISSPLLFRLLRAAPALKSASLMVQREVGLRWIAPSGTKSYGLPSVLIALSGSAYKLLDVGRGQFFPAPRVESVVIKIEFFEKTLWQDVGFDFLMKFLSQLFSQRRKTVLNSLKDYVKKDFGTIAVTASELLSSCGISPNLRPEQISPESFLNLARATRQSLMQEERG